MAANTIEEVLAQLQTIITDSERNNDRTGYFAALYYKVTAAVKAGIATNQFENGPRMEMLDVLFANRYLTALDQWKKGQPLSGCWAVAFEATKRRSYLFLQHLLLGMNAHINLDLGIAAVECVKAQAAAKAGADATVPAATGGNAAMQTIQSDFNAINAIIGSLTYEVTNDINRVSPLMSLLGLHADNTESLLVQFSITNARDGAWCFAEELGQKTSTADVDACIAARDQDITALGRAVIVGKGMIGLTLWIIHLFEWKRPARIVRALYGSKRTFIKAAGLAAAGKAPGGAGAAAGKAAGTAGAAARRPSHIDM
jgi:Family of unknown function (DUF5995)